MLVGPVSLVSRSYLSVGALISRSYLSVGALISQSYLSVGALTSKRLSLANKTVLTWSLWR